MKYTITVLKTAHKHSSDHRSEIEASEVCGCFSCERTMPPSDVEEWEDDEETALCPHCSVEALIGSASGFPVTEPEFLGAMKRHWF
jgi:hypothetical protein